MSVKLAGPSLEQNYGFLRTAYGMIPRRCVNKTFWHNEHQDGSGEKVPSEMVFIPKFRFDRSLVLARGLAAAADIPAALDGQEFGGFWIDKYQASQPNASVNNPYPDISQNAAPGIHAARSQQGVPVWDYIQQDEAILACENRGGIITGTADSGGSNRMVDAALTSAQDGYYVGWRLTLTSGPESGNSRMVTKYDAATKTVYTDGWSLGPATGNTYRLTQFHLASPEEWAAIALLSLMFGTQPHGCNNSQSTYTQSQANGDVDYGYEKGVPDPTLTWGDNDIFPRILTGTGPATFAHNHDASGVFDLNGNVREWVDLQIGGTTDYVISQVNGSGDHAAVGKTVPSASGYFNAINSDAEMSKLVLPNTGSSNVNFGQDYYYVNSGLRGALRGGIWSSATLAGVFGWSLYAAPSGSGNAVGFRAALAVI